MALLVCYSTQHLSPLRWLICLYVKDALTQSNDVGVGGIGGHNSANPACSLVLSSRYSNFKIYCRV